MLDIAGIGIYLAEIIFQELIVTNMSARLKENILGRKIINLIEETLNDTISDTPGFQNELESEKFADFLQNPVVLYEIRKLTSVRGGEPNVIVLCKEWFKIDPIVRGNREFLLSRFLSRISNRLWEIEELQEKLHIKDSFDTNALVRSQLTQLSSQIKDIQDQTIFQPKSDDDIKFSIKLDISKDLLSQERPHAALDILREIEKEVANKNISGYLRFRLNTLIGACEYNLGNHKGAIARLQIALKFASSDPKALANAALAMLLDENYDNAIELADQSIANGGDDTVARAIKIQAIAYQNNYQHLDALVDEHYFGNCDYVRALGYIFHRQKDFDSAEKYYKLAISQNNNDYHSLMDLAQVVMEKNF